MPLPDVMRLGGCGLAIGVLSGTGTRESLSQIADIRYELEEGVIWRRDRLPTITVRSDVRGNAQGPDVTHQIDPALNSIRARLPLGSRA